jgi:hypothetical protein
MRRLYLVGFLLLAGCQNVVGPFEHRKPEQQRRGRDRLALPDDTGVAPRTGVVSADPHGR